MLLVVAGDGERGRRGGAVDEDVGAARQLDDAHGDRRRRRCRRGAGEERARQRQARRAPATHGDAREDERRGAGAAAAPAAAARAAAGGRARAPPRPSAAQELRLDARRARVAAAPSGRRRRRPAASPTAADRPSCDARGARYGRRRHVERCAPAPGAARRRWRSGARARRDKARMTSAAERRRRADAVCRRGWRGRWRRRCRRCRAGRRSASRRAARRRRRDRRAHRRRARRGAARAPCTSGVPMTAPSAVRRFSSSPAPAPSAPGRMRAMPKSSTLTVSPPSLRGERNTFSGFRSRWMTPRACAASRPRRTGDGDGAGAPGASGPRQLVGERVAGEQLHDEVELPVGGAAEVGDAHDVLVVDEAGGARLGGEARDGVGLRAELRMEQLERDLLLQEQVVGDVDPAHAALGEQAPEAVLAVDDGGVGQLGRHAPATILSRCALERGSRGSACRCR